MIIQLGVTNVALIRKLNVDILNGMTVLTGETGAGKSIIIDSINMILGDKTRKELVRNGEEKAVVQAVFDISDELAKELSDEGIETEENQLIIMREITAAGKSICKMNGTIVTLSLLRSFAQKLVNIHGQHDNQALLDPKKHMNFVDRFGRAESELEAYKAEYENYRSIIKQIEKLNVDESERIRRLDLLKYQIKEIEGANLVPGEEDDLKEQRDIIANAEAIAKNSEIAYDQLYGGSSVQSAYDSISIAADALSSVDEYPKISEILESIRNAMYAVEEAAHEIKDFSSGIEYDEAVLNDIEERLDAISKLKRKYGNSIENILKYLEEIKEECNGIENSDELSQKLNEDLKKSRSKLTALAEALSAKRKNAADKLQKDIKNALSELDMGSCEFEVRISKTNDFTAAGTDEAEFFISTNAGEVPKPLEKVASGGELSRVMLAMKSVLADSDNVDTLIFDEIDTGVSGNAARKIAIKLSQIAKAKQVICISHLPQIAAAGNNHFYISKAVTDGRTETSLKYLTEVERCTEIARITDGEVTETSLMHAKEMLARAKEER